MSIHLAYDGSISGDWAARYAIVLASQRPERALRVVHVETGEIPGDRLNAKLAHIEAECRAAQVTVQVDIIPCQHSISRSLEETVGADDFLICGTRVRRGRHGYLRGTVSDDLLQAHHCNVIALRVVQPGVLGVPRNLLVPVLRGAAAFASSLPFLRLFAGHARHLQLVQVTAAGGTMLWRPSLRRLTRLRHDAVREARQLEQQVIEGIGVSDRMIDTSVRVTDDWPREVLILANRYRSDLICIEAPPRPPLQRLLYGDRLERLLRNAPCDVALYRGP